MENEVDEPVEEIITSTPVKAQVQQPEVDSIAVLKRNISDTLTFLHQERNDFLPDDDIIIPSRKDDHVAKEINLDSITLRKEKVGLNNSSDVIENHDDLRDIAENEVEDVIKTAEEVVNDIRRSSKTTAEIVDDSLDNLESLKDDSLTQAQQKSEEAFKFLENEASSPLIGGKTSFEDTALFVQREKELYSPDLESKSNEATPNKTSKSGIPISKNKLKNEKDLDVSQFDGRDSVSPTESELLSKIPVSAKGSKVKTIKKHSKDPLKEFVKLSQDVNWDDDDNLLIKTDPIVKTTVTRITTETIPEDMKTVATAETLAENIKSKIPVLQNDIKIETKTESPSKSKIPVLVTETTRIMSPESTRIERTIISPESTQFVETTIVSPGSKVSTKSNTLDSDSDSDCGQGPQQGFSKKNNMRTIGSSSGSDVALHEAGGELSDEGSGKCVSPLFDFYSFKAIICLSKFLLNVKTITSVVC